MNQVVLAPLDLPIRHRPFTLFVLLLDKAIATSWIVNTLNVEINHRCVRVEPEGELASLACFSRTRYDDVFLIRYELAAHRDLMENFRRGLFHGLRLAVLLNAIHVGA